MFLNYSDACVDFFTIEYTFLIFLETDMNQQGYTKEKNINYSTESNRFIGENDENFKNGSGTSEA